MTKRSAALLVGGIVACGMFNAALIYRDSPSEKGPAVDVPYTEPAPITVNRLEPFCPWDPGFREKYPINTYEYPEYAPKGTLRRELADWLLKHEGGKELLRHGR